MSDPAEDFWRFSLALYGRPGVEACCIMVQDKQGLDVNQTLYCCWVGATGRGSLTPQALAAAEAAVAAWRVGVVEKLREARRAIKAEGSGLDALYAKAKEIELAAEREAQHRLAALAPAPAEARLPAERLADAIANLALYLGAAAPAEPLQAALREMIV